MNATTGRPSIGPKVAANLPKEDIDRLDQIAEESDVKRSDVIRDGLRWYLDAMLGYLPPSPELAEQMDGLQACVWGRTNADLPKGVRNQAVREVAKAITQADVIARIHSRRDEWDIDLSSVWQAILENQDEGLTRMWARALLEYAALVREQEGNDHLLVKIDVIQWTLTLSAGLGHWSAVREVTYTWELWVENHPDRSVTVLRAFTTNNDELMDGWGAASRMVLREYLDKIPEHAGTHAEELLREASSIPDQVVSDLLSEWARVRREKAAHRLGRLDGEKYWSADEVAKYERELLGREPAWQNEEVEITERVRLKNEAEKEVRRAFAQLVDAELVRMAEEEREHEEKVFPRKPKRVIRRRGTESWSAPKPVEEEPLAEWEIQLLKDSEAKAVDDE